MPAATIARLTLPILVASLIVTPYDVRAFRSSASIAPRTIPITIGPVNVPITQTTSSNDAVDFNNSDMTERRKKKKIKYDLGIGKNRAINNDNDSNNNDNNLSSSDEGLINPNPTQFLVEHEAVRPYPSPTNNSNNSNNNQNDKEKSKGANNNNKKLPIISHVRRSEDVLHIQDPTNADAGEYHNGDNNNLGGHPIIIPINSYDYSSSSSIGDDISNKSAEVVKFDLNTVWVEMMLHNEHKKLTSASN